MDSVEGMMKGLKLSEAESRGVFIGSGSAERGLKKEMQAVGKIMAEKPAIAEAVKNALGPIWCPMKGIDCKEIGENIFLFTFHQAGGRKKAVDNGPWTFEKDLIVMEEFDPHKTATQYEFCSIPIWVRVYKLPVGMMSKATGELIGDRIGEYMEVEADANGMAIGKCLRVKVRMNILKPLMRGTLVKVDEVGRTIWCNFEYEYLPDFCFVCGLLGHVEKECDIKLKKGEEAQYGKWMKWIPQRRNNSANVRFWSDRGERKNYSLAYGGNKYGSDGPSWRKPDNNINNSTISTGENERDGTSRSKLTHVGEKESDKNEMGGKQTSGNQLALVDEGTEEEEGIEGTERNDVSAEQKGNNAMLVDGEYEKVVENAEKEGFGKESSHEDGNKGEVVSGEGTIEAGKKKERKYRKIVREGRGVEGDKVHVGEKKKRSDEMDVDVMLLKGSKNVKDGSGKEVLVFANINDAGLSEQPCNAQ
nr:uncharacterized protein LOC127328880 [Lolium perenne]